MNLYSAKMSRRNRNLSEEEHHRLIDEHVEKSKRMIGTEVNEIPMFNTAVNRDQAAHFLRGLGDVNPRWHPDEPGDEVHPLYLTSVKHLSLHGDESMHPPVDHLFAGIDFKWYGPVRIGDNFIGRSYVNDVFEKESSDGKRLVFIISEQEFKRDGRVIAKNNGTMINRERGTLHTSEREIYQYSDAELEEIKDGYDEELRLLESVPAGPRFDDVEVGDRPTPTVRGPLSLACLFWWRAYAGPPGGGNIIDYAHLKRKPDRAITSPHTGWIHDTADAHEDPYLAECRGMPLPFGNGVQMTGWSMPFSLNWMGDTGRLKRYKSTVKNPLLYGDILWTDGKVASKNEEDHSIEIEWMSKNQLDQVVVSGKSEIVLPN